MQDILTKKAPACWKGWIKKDTFLKAGRALVELDINPAGELITQWALSASEAEFKGEELFVIQLPKTRAYEILFELQKLIDSGK